MGRNSAVRRFFGVFGFAMILLWGACSFLQEIWEPQDVVAMLQEEEVFIIPPTINITHPTNGQEVGTLYELRGNFAKGELEVEYVFYSTDGKSFNNIPFTVTNWSVLIVLDEDDLGKHTNYVYAVDEGGNRSSVETVWVEQTDIPWISIKSHTNNQFLNERNITVSGTTDVGFPYTVTNVKVKVDDGDWVAGSVNGTNWSADIELSGDDGAKDLTAMAFADSGKTNSYDRTVILDTTPPTITITSHTDGEIVDFGYQLAGTVTDAGSGVSKVYYRLGESGNFSEPAIAGGNWNTNITLDVAGIHTNYIYAVDNIGNISETNTVYVELAMIYVSIEGGDDGGQGSKSEPFKTIQKAIDKAGQSGIANIYIAQGIYTPGNGLNSESVDYQNSGAFIDVAGLTILGGWDADFTERNGISELDGNSELNHIIWIDDVANVTIDGFVIRGGLANGSNPHNRGGGVYINQGSGHLIQNTVISNNTAELGGGVCFHDTSPNATHSLNNVVISGNFGYGVAIVNRNSNPQGIGAIDWGTDNTPENINWDEYIYVSSVGDDNNGGFKTLPVKSIQKAVEIAGGFGLSSIRVAQGIYTPGNGLNIKSVDYQNSGIRVNTGNLTILGGWDADFTERNGITELDGESLLKHVVWIDNVANVTIDGFVIRGGLANAASAPHDRGGGVYINQGSGHLITNTVISNNTASGRGGGVCVWHGTNHTISATITSNTANSGGGVYVSGGTSHTINGTISGNGKAHTGGGVYVSEGTSHTISGTISGNEANFGGGVYVSGTSHTISATISGNTGTEWGGGVYMTGGESHEISATITGNTANSGGGVYFSDTTPNVTHTFVSPTIEGNSQHGVARGNDKSDPLQSPLIDWGGEGNAPDNWDETNWPGGPRTE